MKHYISAILRWDKLMSKIKVSSNDQEVDTTEVNITKITYIY